MSGIYHPPVAYLLRSNPERRSIPSGGPRSSWRRSFFLRSPSIKRFSRELIRNFRSSHSFSKVSIFFVCSLICFSLLTEIWNACILALAVGTNTGSPESNISFSPNTAFPKASVSTFYSKTGSSTPLKYFTFFVIPRGLAIK